MYVMNEQARHKNWRKIDHNGTTIIGSVEEKGSDEEAWTASKKRIILKPYM